MPRTAAQPKPSTYMGQWIRTKQVKKAQTVIQKRKSVKQTTTTQRIYRKESKTVKALEHHLILRSINIRVHGRKLIVRTGKNISEIETL